MDFLLLLAQEAQKTDEVLMGLSGAELGGGITAILAVLGTIGGGFKWLWNAMMSRLDVIREDFKEQIQAKDKQIDELSKKLSTKSDEVAATTERLQAQTIAKIEDYAEKNADLMDKYVEAQAKLSAILSAIEVRLQK